MEDPYLGDRKMYHCEVKAILNSSNKTTGEFFIKLPLKLAQNLAVKENGEVDALSLAELIIDTVVEINHEEVNFAAHQALMKAIYGPDSAIENPKSETVKQKF